MAGIKIKRNDTVEVIAGKDKGKRGRVLRIMASKDRLLVEHVMMIKKHVKPNPQRNIKGGIAEQESSIHISNVMLVDGEGNKTRVAKKLEGDTRVRYSKVSGNQIPEKKVKTSH
jgi:large subunit ribosomal protein L24